MIDLKKEQAVDTMKIFDLTHMIKEQMPVYPGTEPPSLKNTNTIEVDGFAEKLFSMYSHTGTHIDAPKHMVEEGLGLDDFDISKFVLCRMRFSLSYRASFSKSPTSLLILIISS